MRFTATSDIDGNGGPHPSPSYTQEEMDLWEILGTWCAGDQAIIDELLGRTRFDPWRERLFLSSDPLSRLSTGLISVLGAKATIPEQKTFTAQWFERDHQEQNYRLVTKRVSASGNVSPW